MQNFKTIYTKLEAIEKALEAIKLQLFFSEQPKVNEEEIVKEVKKARKELWKKYYATKI